MVAVHSGAVVCISDASRATSVVFAFANEWPFSLRWPYRTVGVAWQRPTLDKSFAFPLPESQVDERGKQDAYPARNPTHCPSHVEAKKKKGRNSPHSRLRLLYSSDVDSVEKRLFELEKYDASMPCVFCND